MEIREALDVLPGDVWRIIFGTICIDTGYTAACISRSCKAFKAICVPFQYRIVSLSKVRLIENFIDSFDSALSAATARGEIADLPRVQFLLLRFLPRATDVPPWPGREAAETDFHDWQQAKSAWNGRFVRSVTRLFALVAPRLEVLTVLQSPIIPLPFVPCTLPALRELALLEDDRMFLRLANDYGANSKVGIPDEPSNTYFYGAGVPPDLDSWAEARPFPVLETLHIVYGTGMSKIQPWSATIPIWATLVPRLKHLRIDNASRNAITTVYRTVNERPRTKFRHLRTVAMQTSSPRAEDDLAYVTSQPPREGHRRRRPQVTLVGRPPFAEVTESIWRQRIVVEWYRKLPGRDRYP